MSTSDALHAGPFPAVDDHLVPPGAEYEIWDGEIVEVPAAEEPHAERHSKVAALIEAHAGPEFDVASEMLTRTSQAREFAPDVSVYPMARDPVTGGRQLEHLAFEVVSTVPLSTTGARAAELMRRGVRRVFAIDVGRSRVMEWLVALGTWSMLQAGTYIDDRSLAVPLPIDELVRAGKADDAVARALIDNGNPVIAEVRAQERAAGRQEGLSEGQRQGQRDAILQVLEARGIELSPHARARILGERDPERLRGWLGCAARCSSAAELFAET
jgi:Uma2 family endonuclease